GRVTASDRDYQKLQDIIIRRALTIHVTMMNGGGGTSGGGAQTEIGLNVTKMTSGRYENITTTNRLATLPPERGKKIAEQHARQLHQFRVTYERPANAKAQARIGASVRKDAMPMLSIDGRLPQ